MTCHNGLPQPLAGSLNGYEAVPAGIDCERCHGPGGEHVRQKLAGILVDTATAIDYTIVHPGKLPLEAQLDLCQRCHLQGVTVLNDGADWFDFRPGDRISDHWNIFLPDFAGGNGGFLMASQAERLRRSACFVSSGGISCITCHNPHQSVRTTPREVFNKPCKDCHGGGKGCTATLAVRQAGGDDCSRCHMPRSGSVDIPHVTITDHKVSIPGRAAAGQGQFNGLECLTDSDPEPLTMARGYLRFFEAFSTDPAMLDSANRYLDLAAQTMSRASGSRGSPAKGSLSANSGSNANHNASLLQRTRLHAFYLQKDYAAGAALTAGVDPAAWSDAWSCYRAGECLTALGNTGQAERWLARAVELLPKHPDFRLKYANALASLGQSEAAIREYKLVLQQDPLAVQAWSNLGFLTLQGGKGGVAEQQLRQAARLDPDYVPARLHLAQWYRASGRELESNVVLRQLLKRHGSDPAVLALAERWQVR
jgi:Tfp pilus assembly protein PilF